MQTMAAIESAISRCVGLTQPSARNVRQVSSSVATVIPEIGFDEEPISPVNREETVTNRNPKSTISSAATRLMTNVAPMLNCPKAPKVSVAQIMSTSNSEPTPTKRSDRSRSVRLPPGDPEAPACAEVAERRRERAEDQRQGLKEADDAARGHGPRADAKHVGFVDVFLAHLTDELRGRGRAARSARRRRSGSPE